MKLRLLVLLDGMVAQWYEAYIVSIAGWNDSAMWPSGMKLRLLILLNGMMA